MAKMWKKLKCPIMDEKSKVRFIDHIILLNYIKEENSINYIYYSFINTKI